MINRFSSRRTKLDQTFLNHRLQRAQAYDRIAGYFRSSILEVASEALESITGQIRVICNSDLIVWEDISPEAIQWVQEEFDALWYHPLAVNLALKNWLGLAPEERWWLFTMTNAATGHAISGRLLTKIPLIPKLRIWHTNFVHPARPLPALLQCLQSRKVCS